MNVYHRHDDGTLGKAAVDTADHNEAILTLCESLVDTGIGYNKPVLAVIKGGKRDGS